MRGRNSAGTRTQFVRGYSGLVVGRVMALSALKRGVRSLVVDARNTGTDRLLVHVMD